MITKDFLLPPHSQIQQAAALDKAICQNLEVLGYGV